MYLTRYDSINEEQFNNYIYEWESREERISPSMVKFQGSDMDFNSLQRMWREFESADTVPEGRVPGTLYFMLDDNSNIIGAIDFRYELNDYLLDYGGHIGYGIRPSERMKGYGKIILKLMIDHIDRDKYDKVLVTCYEDNIGSARIIESMGGKLENIVNEDGRGKKRYWIEL